MPLRCDSSGKAKAVSVLSLLFASGRGLGTVFMAHSSAALKGCGRASYIKARIAVNEGNGELG